MSIPPFSKNFCGLTVTKFPPIFPSSTRTYEVKSERRALLAVAAKFIATSRANGANFGLIDQSVGAGVAVGTEVGIAVGAKVGTAVGLTVGMAVGLAVGIVCSKNLSPAKEGD